MQSPPVGSDFYYALRFGGQDPAPLSQLWAFVQTIQAIRTPLLDESVVPVKLQWWQAEIKRTFEDQPQHPITKALLPIIEAKSLPESAFQALIEAQCHVATQPVLKDWEEFQQHAIQTKGAELQLFSHYLAAPNPLPTGFCHYMSVALYLIEKVAQFGQDLQQGELAFAKADLDFFKLTPTQLFNKQCHTEKLASLLLRQSNRAKQAAQKAFAAIPLDARFSQVPLLILLHLNLSLLNEIEREHFNVLAHTYRLTPLRQCWIAWRCYRTEKRRRQHGTRYLTARTI